MPKMPPRYKLALLTWGAAYVVITIVLALLGPAIQDWPLPLRTLLISALMVGILTWLVLPVVTRLFGAWLMRGRPRASSPGRSPSRPASPRSPCS